MAMEKSSPVIDDNKTIEEISALIKRTSLQYEAHIFEGQADIFNGL